MTTATTSALAPEWKDRLGLTHRQSAELYESADTVSNVKHAPAIRAALNEMGLSAIFCVQGGAQGVEAEMRQERRCSDKSLGRAGLRAARAGCDEATIAQAGDGVTRNFLAEDFAQLAAIDRLETGDGQQHRGSVLRQALAG